MIYKNVKTGATLETESKLGGNWMPVAAPEKPEKTAPKKKVKKK